LIDERLGDGGALDFLKQSVSDRTAAAVVVVSDKPDDDEGVRALLERGAQEVVGPNLSGDQLLQVLRRGVHRQLAHVDLRRQNRELQLANAELVAIAQHDPMTGLLNRRGLAEALAREAERARRTTTRLAVVLADCDDFKRINDDFGYEAGDRVLTEVARSIAEVVRPTDYVVRLGGDEFLILLTEVRAEECRKIAERVRVAVACLELEAAGRPMPMTCSVGWAWLKDDQLEVDTIVQFAEGALKRSKAVGKDTVSGCDTQPPGADSIPPISDDGIELREILQALSEGACMSVVGQPIVRLPGKELVAYELCTRGPAGGFEMPDEFFQLSVENDRGARVDLGCLKASARAWQATSSRGSQKCGVHVNVFPSTLAKLGVGPVLEVLARLREVAGRCCVEISERRIVGSPAPLVETVEVLRQHGFEIALDDVGLSRGALEALVILRPTFMKIDRRLVRCCDRDLGRQRTLQRLLDTADSLSIEAIAVGVETEAEVELIQKLGYRYGQGYAWGRPQQLEALAVG